MLKEKARLNLGKYTLIKASAAEVTVSKEEQPIKQVHHLFVLDCSGSMTYQLGQIRTDLYNKISTLMKPEDSVTIVWFSSRGECGILVEDFRLKSNISLTQLRTLIERELHPRGLTAFKDPLVESKNIIARVSTKNKDVVHSLFFLTDGHDNQYSEKEILLSISELKPLLVSAAIIEYGYYCNRKLLSEMSMEVGGVHVFSSDFQDYEPYLKKQFEQKVRSERKKVRFGPVHGNIVFSKSGDAVVISKVDEDGNAFIDVDAGDVYSLWDNSLTSITMAPQHMVHIQGMDGKDVRGNTFSAEMQDLLSGAYMAMFAFSRKSDYATISEILRNVGDAYLIRKKANTFGTQKINELEADFLAASNSVDAMYIDGYNPNLEPREDAYNVIDMIDDLMEHDNNLWYPNDPAFSYERIGRKAVLAGKKASKDDKENLKLLIEQNNTAEALKKLQELAQEPTALKFELTDKDKGYPIHNLVWNNSRANLSVQVLFEGTVELPENAFGLPKVFPTKKFRNFTIIKDGIINTYRLPVSLNKATFDKLQKNDLLEGETYEDGKVYVLDFSSLPVINQKMVKETSAKELFQNQFKLVKVQARNTVFNHLKKAYFDNVSIDFAAQYGEEAAAWLKEIGITPNGYAPKVTLEPSTEETVVNTLSVKIDKMTIPNAKKDFESIMAKMDKGMGLTPREKLLEGPINEFKTFEKLNDGLKDKDKKTLIETWLSARSNEIRKEKARLMNEISRTQFVTIVGKAWFTDLDSRDDKEMLLEMDGEERKFIIEDKMETIKI